MRKISIVIGFLSLFVSCTTKYGKVLKSTDYDYKLKMANEYFAQKKYKNAEELYLELFPVMKGTDKFEDLYYKFAYSAFYQKNYSEAGTNFKGFLEVFPNSTKAEDAAYMYAYTFYMESPKVDLEQVNTTRFIGMMQSFINTHPNSSRIKEASDIIDKGRAKLERKEYNNAELYYKISQYHAAAIAFSSLLNTYPESEKGDYYKLMAIKSYYLYAKLSIYDKQQERFEKVLSEYNDFTDRFPDSKLKSEAEGFNNQSLNYIKEIQHEQTKTSANR